MGLSAKPDESEQTSTASIGFGNTSDIEKANTNIHLDHDIEKQAQDLESTPQTTTPPNEESDPSLVEFNGPDDPGNPKNWSARRRIAITVSMGSMTFVVTFASSIFAVAIQPVSEEFNIGTVTATLGVALFLLVSETTPFTTFED